MNKIIYFTTAQDNEDFAKNLPLWSVAPNTSNQNFHNKMIRALATMNDVNAVSIRPINHNFKYYQLPGEVKTIGNVTWIYPKVKDNKIYKALVLNRKTDKMITFKEGVVVVDILNLSLLKNAKRFARKHHLKIIGICTDDPRNISFCPKGYAEKILKLTSDLDGYVCLTPKLGELFDNNNKPMIVIDGVTESVKPKKVDLPRPYVFFCGSLMHEYGVYNLIQAFDNLKLEGIDLVVCGHHKEPNFESFVHAMENIKYVGVKTYDEIIDLEANSLFTVNPRPINERIDEYSIPSKTLESLANGALTICTDNELLKKNYESVIIWAESGEVEDLQTAMEKALKLTDKEKADMISAGKKIVMSRTGFEYIATAFEQLL